MTRESGENRPGPRRRVAKHRAAENGHGLGARIAEHGAGMAAEIRDAAEERVEGLRQAAVGYVQEGRDRVLGIERMIEDQIARRPFRAMMIAAGAGLLVGLLCRRR